ncbi:glucuronate isomerase [Cognatiyoonia sp. IB215182]|uniref:glucuronate isomerase n=1 Tax=Cognatiyoonia sp. IB215182 TaxID=3097353 RepID=UPI002A0AB1D0|nr:glucuronate isomerase [Cognatiyoonia sp. IB215182]MDX8355363.1 glucuronate isomerase [Cognatiyoonia sp. IB215182]
MPKLDRDRLFPLDKAARTYARELYESIADLPIISPHGHTDPAWFALNAPFPDPAQLFVTPDHYLLRMLYSQGVPLEALGIPRTDGAPVESDSRVIWRKFAAHYYLFRATPSHLWMDHALAEVFGVTENLNADTADEIYDHINACLAAPAYRPRALFDRFGIAALATTDAALDSLDHHQTIADADWPARIIPTYRPDAVVDPDASGFIENVAVLGELTGHDTQTWKGYLDAHRARRAFFKSRGATATDHGHADPTTADLDPGVAAALFDRIIAGDSSADDRALFRAQMLTEMAGMSVNDGLVMQLHPGSDRNHAASILETFGPDKGFDIPKAVDYTNALKPLLNKHGLNPDFSLIVFTLDEATYARELAPLAGVYPALKLGPAWWFFDSPEGMRRYREATTETAGFYNTAGFNDDTRAFCSIPARHDVARRVDSAYLATLVATGRLSRADAAEVAHDLAYRLAKQAYRL